MYLSKQPILNDKNSIEIFSQQYSFGIPDMVFNDIHHGNKTKKQYWENELPTTFRAITISNGDDEKPISFR